MGELQNRELTLEEKRKAVGALAGAQAKRAMDYLRKFVQHYSVGFALVQAFILPIYGVPNNPFRDLNKLQADIIKFQQDRAAAAKDSKNSDDSKDSNSTNAVKASSITDLDERKRSDGGTS